MSDLTPSWGGQRLGAGRKPGDIGRADRIKRYAVAEKAAQYADEIISFYAEVFRNQGEDTLVRMAAGKWLWEDRLWQTGAGRRHHAQPAQAGPPGSLASAGPQRSQSRSRFAAG